MCFESLIDGDATEKPLRELVRDETGSALKDASIAALTVAAVLVVSGISSVLVGVAALAALVFGFLLHQVVLVAGVGIVRWRTTGSLRPDHEPTTS